MSLLDWERIKELNFNDNFEKLSRPELGTIKVEAQKEDEFRTLLYFLEEYEKITGKEFVEINSSERPDFLCSEQSQKTVGVELTQVRKKYPEMMGWDAIEIIQKIVEKKECKRKEPDWKFSNNSMLIIEFNDIPLNSISDHLNKDNLPDIYQTGFSEIWIVDLTNIEAYHDVELFCFIPETYKGYYPRPFQKPYC